MQKSEGASHSIDDWRVIYKAFYPRIVRLVRGMGGTLDDARDMFHDGLVVLLRNVERGYYRHESKIGTYLYGICRNLWRRELARKRKELTAWDEALSADEQEQLHHLFRIELVVSLLPQLKPDCERLLHDYFLKNVSLTELKDYFNVGSIQALHTKKWRCTGELLELFKEAMNKPSHFNRQSED